MNYFLNCLLFMGITLQVGVNAHLIKSPCDSACPRIFAPICATNDVKEFKYFYNECLMNYDICRSEEAWKPTRISYCLQQVEPTPENQSCVLRVCQFIYDPVCAMNVNGALEIFANKCVFEIENCLANGQWKLTRGDECGLSSDG